MAGHDNRYQLVGECYVHGLMHGEGLLGPIPSGWERKYFAANDVNYHIWEHGS